MLWILRKLIGKEPIFGSKAGYKYGYKKDRPDTRDHVYVPKMTKAAPKEVDLRSQDGPIYDQGQLGSCTANAILGLFAFVCKKLFGNVFEGSRLMLYYNERDIEGTVGDDSGAYIRDGMTTLNKDGVCPETMWPYDTSKFADKPSDACYAEGKKHTATEYMRVDQDLAHLKACLAEGFPFTFGFTVYESFESSVVARTGIMPMPKKGESVLGGHAVTAVGYIDKNGKAKFVRTSDAISHSVRSFFASALKLVTHGTTVTKPTDCFIVRNSWGVSWGDKGYFYMPYAYMTSSRCDDFWTVRVATGTKVAA